MAYDSFKHHRRSIRLKGYDYSQRGAYFVTICTQNRECVLGNVVNQKIILADCAKWVTKWWLDIPNHFPVVDLDAWVIMPNHLHGIIAIETDCRGEVSSPKLGNVIAYFKYQSTKEINQNGNISGVRFWQRNYYEHIVRNSDDLNRIREYIQNNPQNWISDDNNPTNQKS